MLIYQKLVGARSDFSLVGLLFVFFALQMILRTKFNPNLSPLMLKSEVAWSALQLWTVFLLTLKMTSIVHFQHLFVVLTASLLSLLALIICCFGDRLYTRLLGLNLKRIKKDVVVQNVLENLCFLYTRAKGNDRKAKLLLSGYIEQIRKSHDFDQGSPLLLFSSGWEEDRAFSDSFERDNRAFLLYLSNQYLIALRK